MKEGSYEFKYIGHAINLKQHEWKPRHNYVRIIRERCKGCNLCIEFCPKKILESSEEFNSKGYHPPRIIESFSHGYDDSACVGCGYCALICPEFAIYTLPEEENSEQQPFDR
jgi:2-oxoglutarate ferredoxin oxidoreductase subunit delta